MAKQDNDIVTRFQVKDLPFIYSALQDVKHKSQKTGIPISPEMQATYEKAKKAYYDLWGILI